MSTSLDTALRETLDERLDDLSVPPGDLPAAMRRGRSKQRRRRLVAGGVALAATAALVAAVVVLNPRGASEPDVATYPSVGAIDASQGMRAYDVPGRALHLGDREVPSDQLEWLDTDAAVTPEGLAFYDDGRPYLLGLDGETVPLVEGPVDPLDERRFYSGFHPTAKAGADGSLAYASMTDGRVTVWLRADPTDADASSVEADCGDACKSLVIDAVDRGTVYGHTDDGTFLWDVEQGDWRTYTSGEEFGIADVRAGTVLYSGRLPAALARDLPGDTVQGPIDATLTFDGRNVLNWSPVLRPVGPQDDPIELKIPGIDRAIFPGYYAFDTDGSVLAAVPFDTRGLGDLTRVYDCDVATGECQPLDEVRSTHGDPAFVGNDM